MLVIAVAIRCNLPNNINLTSILRMLIVMSDSICKICNALQCNSIVFLRVENDPPVSPFSTVWLINSSCSIKYLFKLLHLHLHMSTDVHRFAAYWVGRLFPHAALEYFQERFSGFIRKKAATLVFTIVKILVS